MIIPISKKFDCNCQVSESEFPSEAPIDSLRLLQYANKGDDWKNRKGTEKKNRRWTERKKGKRKEMKKGKQKGRKE